MRCDRVARHCAFAASCSLLAPAAYGDFTSFNRQPPPGELSQAQILGRLYGGTFTASGSVDFSNGAVRAQRVHDFAAQGNAPAMNMSSPTGGFDQDWLPNFDHATATLRVASFADFGQDFGYFSGEGLQGMMRLFTLPPFSNNFFPNLAIAMPQFPDEGTIKWGRAGGMPPRTQTSRMEDNPGQKDHMITYEIVTPGVGPGAPRKWVLFWEDLMFNKPILDNDYNDLAVEVIADTLEGERWTNTGGGTWQNGGNWMSGTFPNGDDKIAHFGEVITGPSTITLNGAITVNGVRLNSIHGYTFTGGALNLGGQGIASPFVRADQGNHTFRNDVHIDNSPGGDSAVATFSVARSDDVLRFAGNFTVNPTLPLTIFKAGPGQVELKRLRATGTPRQALNLNVEGGTFRLSDGGGTTRLNSLVLFPATKFDLGNNAVVFDHDGDSPLEQLRGYIASGYDGGSWDGDGINSLAAAANTTHGIGYAENDASSNGVNFAMFGTAADPITVDNTSVLLRYTRYGDANLDGVVTLQDFARLAGNFGSLSGRDWSEGDFDYDGDVDIPDFNRLANNFGINAGATGALTPKDWAILATAIPEPSVLAACAALLAIGRPRNRRRGTGA